jgi:S1-C subfamily serine protease
MVVTDTGETAMGTPTFSTAGARGTTRNGLRLIGPLALAGALLLAACGSAVTITPSPSAAPSAAPSATPGIAFGLQNDFVNAVGQVSPSVVTIETKTGLGSGVVFDDKGDILTNNHVVTGATTFKVTLADGQEFAGTLVGTYPAGDLAVVHVTATSLRPATFGDSSKLSVGDIVLAIGNPLAFQGSVTQGIVSALDRSVAESASVTLPNVIQTSAAINPGNSGGALVDLSGHVVGIPTLAALDPEFSDTPANGIGFAITSNAAVDVATQLIANGKVTTPPAPNASAAVTQ